MIAAGCTYEVVALISGWGGRPTRIPTLSKLCRKHRWFEALLLSWLISHFHYQRKPRTME